MRTARQLFQNSAAFKDYKIILENPAFEAACNAAVLDLLENLPSQSADPSKAWDSWLQVVGARKVLQGLSELHQVDTPATPQKWPALKYDTNKPTTRP